MIYVFCNKTAAKLNDATFDSLFAEMPGSIQQKILKFRNWQDVQRCLIGKALLLRGLSTLAPEGLKLADLKYSVYTRPYFNDTIDFNISHSGEYTICAISKTNKVGIDVEQVEDIAIDDLRHPFSAEEWDTVINRKHISNFYFQWTKKEAFIKAVGVGLNVPLHTISLTGKSITWQSKEWFLFEILLREGYKCHLSTDTASPQIIMKEIVFEEQAGGPA